MSTVPQLYEGTPSHDDYFMLTFKTSGTVSVGNVVYLSADYTVAAITASTQLVLGVAITAGVLTQPINVQTRGVVDVIIDASVSGGNYLVGSNTTAGRVISSSGLSTSQLPTVLRAIALNTGSTQGNTVQALIF